MAISAVDKELMQYFTQLNEPQKQSLLQVIKTFLKSGSEINKPLSIEEYNKELNEAMKRINNGKFTTLEELEKEMLSW